MRNSYKKIWIALLLVGISVACQDEAPIEGIWTVHTDFYKATYQIAKESDSYVGKVLFYNDGTSNYNNEKEQSTYYLFKGLKERNKHYVDGVSGATKTASPQTISIHNLHKDTLEVYTYIMRDSIRELWIRKPK